MSVDVEEVNLAKGARQRREVQVVAIACAEHGKPLTLPAVEQRHLVRAMPRVAVESSARARVPPPLLLEHEVACAHRRTPLRHMHRVGLPRPPAADKTSHTQTRRQHPTCATTTPENVSQKARPCKFTAPMRRRSKSNAGSGSRVLAGPRGCGRPRRVNERAPLCTRAEKSIEPRLRIARGAPRAELFGVECERI